MNSLNRKSADIPNSLFYWTASLIFIGSFLLADAEVVTWSAGVASAGELVAASVAYILIAAGAIVTQYNMMIKRQ
jgi:hypothetical protein